MANKAASLIRYAKLEGIGWRRGNLIKAKNGRYRPSGEEFCRTQYLRKVAADAHEGGHTWRLLHQHCPPRLSMAGLHSATGLEVDAIRHQSPSHENSVVTVALPYILRQYHERRLALALFRLSTVILLIFAYLVDEAFLEQSLADERNEPRILAVIGF